MCVTNSSVNTPTETMRTHDSSVQFLGQSCPTLSKSKITRMQVPQFVAGESELSTTGHRGDVYIHRCPFRHCSHRRFADCTFKLRTDSGDGSYSNIPNTLVILPEEKTTTSLQGHTQFKAIVQYRQKAIAYMLSRLGESTNSDPIKMQRLQSYVVALENQVFQDSEFMEEYLVTLARNLSVIFQELNRRKTSQKSS